MIFEVQPTIIVWGHHFLWQVFSGPFFNYHTFAITHEKLLWMRHKYDVVDKTCMTLHLFYDKWITGFHLKKHDTNSFFSLFLLWLFSLLSYYTLLSKCFFYLILFQPLFQHLHFYILIILFMISTKNIHKLYVNT